MLGIVDKYYARPRGNRQPYGFIEGYDGERYYFNYRGLKEEIQIGDEVSFKGARNEKGGFASNVEKASF